jgi:hypothetical protein
MNKNFKLDKHLEFIKVWNDYKQFPTVEEVSEHLNITYDATRSKARRYKALTLRYPEMNLPPILNRKDTIDGQAVYYDHIDTKGLDLSKVKTKRFFITGAQYGAEVNVRLFESVKNYCKRNNAQLIILPMKYGSGFPALHESIREYAVYNNHTLNENLNLNCITLRPTLVNPLSSMERTGGERSQIFAHPKHAMQFVARGANEFPKAIMTTGSITYPEYMPDKTGRIAIRDHSFGGVIVDIQDDKHFTFRHVKADEYNRLYDVSGVYAPDSMKKRTRSRPVALVCGDWHTGHTNKVVRKVTFGKKGIVETLKPKSIFMHDFFDGRSISHHDEKNNMLMAKKQTNGERCLASELAMCVKEMHNILNASCGAKLYVVASNHDEHLDRYLAEGRYIKDYTNFEFAHKLVGKAMREQKPAFIAHMQEHFPEVKFLERDEDCYKAGIKLDMHGDQGKNGSRGSIKQFDTVCSGTVTGHTHTPAIQGTAYQVGTSTDLKLPYTKGLSSWVNTHAVVWENGTVQLINIIDGKWK